MEKPYSNREIDAYHKVIAESLTRIEAQTIKTNGRVTKLERFSTIVLTALAVLFAKDSTFVMSLIKSLI